MSTRNWRKALDRDRAVRARAEQRAADAYVREIATAPCRAGPPNKTEQRKIAAQAVANFAGRIRQMPARRRK